MALSADMTLGFIGAGNMAEALIAGLLAKGFASPGQISACEIHAERGAFIQKKYGVVITQDLASCVNVSRVIILCVKPQQMAATLASLRPLLMGQLVITIAAGITLDFYNASLASNMRVIRVMPNTPALLGLGATAFAGNAAATGEDKALCQNLFEQVGIAFEVPREELLDAVTALSGSGPAFVYRFAAALVDAGIQTGLPKDMAQALALQTLSGAAAMLQNAGESPDDLTRKVTSPGGTTLAGLEVLEKNDFAGVVAKCILRAAERARELSQEFGKRD